MSLKDVFIVNTAVSLPNAPVSNDDIESVLGQINGKISRAKRIVLKRNGIEQRYYALNPSTGAQTHTNAVLTAEAVQNLFLDKSDMHQIECLVTGTTIPDQIAPNHAVMVHGELGIDPCEVIATSGICLSGMSALKYAYLAVKSGDKGLTVSTGSEVVSPLLRADNFAEETNAKLQELNSHPEVGFEKDFLRWMLSDGAGAFLLSSEVSKKHDQLSLRIDWLEILSFANELETCMYIGASKSDDGGVRGWMDHSATELQEDSVMAVKQDVRLLNENIVPITFTKALERIVSEKGLEASEIDFFLPHISSMYFYTKVVDAMEEMGFSIPDEKWFTNLKSKGNTGAASIYIMLDELMKSGRVKAGQKILCFVPESGRFSSSFMLLTAT